MRLLASTGPLFTRPMDWAFGVIAEAGFDGVELMVTPDPATQDPTQIEDAMRTEGITAPVVHGPFLLVTRRVFGSEPVAKAERSLELAGAIGADLMIVHPPYRWQPSFDRWLREEADVAAAALDTRLGVENLYPIAVRGRSFRFHRYTEPDHLAPFTNVVLDTSHLGVAGIDIVEAYEQLWDRTVHLHVSDYAGGARDSHASLGDGLLPLARFLQRVVQDRPDAAGSAVAAHRSNEPSITLELDCRPFLEDRTALVDYLRQERRKCEELLAGGSALEVLGRPDDVEVARSNGGDDDTDHPSARTLRD